MDNCFLFTKQIDDNGCLCLKLSAGGQLIASPEYRPFDEIRNLQAESRTVVVESCSNTLLLDLALPWLPDRKARIAIPYALEDKLAQPVEEVHFAFDKLRHQNNQYLITAIAKQKLLHVISLLKEHQIDFEMITVDWFALNANEIAIIGSDLLVNKAEFKGLLSGDLAKSYLKNNIADEIESFTDSTLKSETSIPKDLLSTTWIAQRLLTNKPLNLCQGEMQQGTDSNWIKNGYFLIAGLCCFWLLSILLVNGINLYRINKETVDVDQKIAVIYREFFPDAKQVISPRFRIGQLLGNSSSGDQTHFWFVLNNFAQAMKNSEISIEQLRYQSKKMSVTLVSPDFAQLQEIENQLKDLKLNVKQTQASTKDEQVIATLELM